MYKESNQHSINLLEALQAEVIKNQLWHVQDKLYLACSGGLDSVVLAHLLHSSGIPFILLHCNFQLRGEESERDEKFVTLLAKQLDVPIKVKRFDTNGEMAITKKGLQETARNLRYDWFSQVLDEDKSIVQKWLLTAHHADDQVETILMHFLRATGLSGIQGMKWKTGFVVRPLLFAARKVLEQYAVANGLLWVEDSSNAKINYTRNFIRHEIVPRLEQLFPSVKTTILENGKRFKEIDLLYQQKIHEITKRLIEKRESGFAIPINKIKYLEPLDTVIYEVFSRFGFNTAQIPEIKKLFLASSGKYVISESFRVLKNRDWLLIEPIVQSEQLIKLVEHATAQITIDNNLLIFQLVDADFPIPANSMQAILNLKKLKFPLMVRKWKSGDYFYPLGMNKKKKISRFMTDIKMSLTEKENQWVIESDKKIVWVIGRRIDDRFKIDDRATSRLMITISRLSE